MHKFSNQPVAADFVIIAECADAVIERDLSIWTELRGLGLQNVFVVSPQSSVLPIPEFVHVIHCADRSPTAKRKIGFMHSQSDLVLFLDDDVRANALALFALQEQCRKSAIARLFAGSYFSPQNLPLSGRAYNRLCNHWVLAASPQNPRFLGGAFALYRMSRIEAFWNGIEQVGGEEEVFARRLAAHGIGLQLCAGLRLEHDSRKSLRAYFVRSIRQGHAAVLAQFHIPRPSGFAALIEATGLEKGWIALHGIGLLCGAFWARATGGFHQLRAAQTSPQTRQRISGMAEANPSRYLQTLP